MRLADNCLCKLCNTQILTVNSSYSNSNGRLTRENSTASRRWISFRLFDYIWSGHDTTLTFDQLISKSLCPKCKFGEIPSSSL